MQYNRTNAINLFHSCKDDEQIKYYDVTSLYPFVRKTCNYPKGVPIIITENFSDNINEYFGLIQCRIIPPKGLYFPVIPARFNGKLTHCVQNVLNKNNKQNVSTMKKIEPLKEHG
jgi:hypothetical protein